MKIMRCYSIACLIVWGAMWADRIGFAHEGHLALPSTGVTREGNQLLISEAAIQAIEMQSATIKLGDLQQTLRVNARVELPWSGQAKATTLTAGKIESVLVKPGQQVAPGAGTRASAKPGIGVAAIGVAQDDNRDHGANAVDQAARAARGERWYRG